MRFNKETMLIEMYPEDAIYHLSIKFLVEKEGYKNPNEENINVNKPFSFSCKISEDGAQNDLFVKFITYLCDKCNHNKYNSLANRICIARMIVFLLQRGNDASPELTSITQKIDETESKQLPPKFEFTDLVFNKKEPKDTLTIMLADFMRIRTGDVSPRRKGSIIGRNLSNAGTHIREAASAAKEAARDASPFSSKTRPRKGSIVNATPPSPTPAPSLPSSHPAPPPSSTNSSLTEFTLLPDEDDETGQAVKEREPLLKPAAPTFNRRTSPLKAPQGQNAFFQKGVLNDPSKDPLKIYQPYEVETKEREFTTSYEKSKDQMTVFCANERLLELLKGTLEKYFTVRLFNKNVIQFKYSDLTTKKLRLNLILPIVFRGLPEAMDQSAKGEMFRQDYAIRKNKKLINDNDADDKTIVLCSWKQCCG